MNFGSQTISWNQAPQVRLAAPPARPARAQGRPSGRLQARYDSVFTHEGNENHWALTDFLSARAANSKEVRRTLRMRCRYEAQNNPIIAGMGDTLANDTVGTGPTLQVGFKDDEWNQIVEQRWREWFREVGMTPRLRVAVKAKVFDGEVFLMIKANRALENSVKLFPLDIEADQVTTLDPKFQKGFWVDGVEMDDLGNPTYYHVLKRHPGDVQDVKTPYGALETDRIPKRFVLHWFRKDRPGQVRGVPELTPSLDGVAQLRRYDKAVLTAAEWAATQSAWLETDLAPEEAGIAEVGAPWETWSLEAGVVTTSPAGYKIKQLQATQPTDTHKEFTGTLIGNNARPLSMPFNVATCNSSGYNFSSGRLDHLPYHRKIAIDRDDIDTIILDPIFAHWWDEAIMIPGYFGAAHDAIVAAAPSADLVPHEFQWPPMDSIDPSKDATADAQNLANGTTSRTALCGQYGSEYRQLRRQQALEFKYDLELATELGLPENWGDSLRPNMPTPTEPDPNDNADGAPPKKAAKKGKVAA
jgi:lambda family phage portal protein